jgi:hypothetical protein
MREVAREELARLQVEVARLTVEAQLLDQALAKLKRSNASAGRGTVTGDQVLEAAKQAEPPFTAPDVRDIFAQQGLEVTANAVRNHLNRLAERGFLNRRDDGFVVVLADPPFIPAGATTADVDFGGGSDEDIPF